jgi:ABC-type glutathione transport system ATPase component
MKILNFSFSDDKNGWSLENVQFDDINLLIGLSGVGKTKILKSILSLKKISNGITFNGIKWNIDFMDSSKKQYTWTGEFSKIDISSTIAENENIDDNRINAPIILYEQLLCDNNKLITRTKDEITYNNQKLPKLLPNKSAIYFLKEESPIDEIFIEINKITLNDHSCSIERQRMLNLYDKDKIIKDYRSVKEIINSNLIMPVRLFWVYNNNKMIFNKIAKHFQDIFPFVNSLRVDLLEENDRSKVPVELREMPFIQIKEKNIDNWIPQLEISSGMFNALMHLCEIYLSADNSVILIDELENSLGINCLGPISDEILDNTRKTQFIITSHHPYIINNIKSDFWKVVTRNSGKVSVTRYEIDIKESHHDPYIQLINSIQYSDGIL